jgi:hypothetical protein
MTRDMFSARFELLDQLQRAHPSPALAAAVYIMLGNVTSLREAEAILYDGAKPKTILRKEKRGEC